MSEAFLVVVAVAFTAQLAVLPGEKVQFIIAALSTRYPPLLVVSAAGSAFAGWTALEILFGETLKRTLPGVYLDAITVVLFAFFAAMLVRSAPDRSKAGPESKRVQAKTDGGSPVSTTSGGALDVTILGWEVPEYFGGFLPIFAMLRGTKTAEVRVSQREEDLQVRIVEPAVVLLRMNRGAAGDNVLPIYRLSCSSTANDQI